MTQKQGEAQSCFTAHILREQETLQLSDDEIAYLAGAMFGAGSDTVSAQIMPCQYTTYRWRTDCFLSCDCFNGRSPLSGGPSKGTSAAG